MFKDLFKPKPKKDKKDMTLKDKIVENVNVILSAYAIAFVIRLLLVEAYQIPSQSMVPSLLVKDILMVEKATFGTYIPIVHWKIPGFVKPHRNDIIVFISPEWKSPGPVEELVSLLSLSLVNLDNTAQNPKNLVKRLVGMPGDTIRMSNQVLVINGTNVPLDPVASKNEVVMENMVARGFRTYDISQESFEGRKRIVQHYDLQANSPALFPREAFDIPEIRVPKKGVPVDIAAVQASGNAYYRDFLWAAVERETGKKLELVAGKFLLGGREFSVWTPKQDYYFGMGDNRDHSQDSRYFGFIPSENVFGRPLVRYFPFHRMGFFLNETAESVPGRDYTR